MPERPRGDCSPGPAYMSSWAYQPSDLVVRTRFAIMLLKRQSPIHDDCLSGDHSGTKA
jgi:hypothetical protein